MIFGIIFTVVVLLAVCWWWFIGRNKPEYPPLEIADDDPLMLEALDKAKATINEFEELLSGEYEEVQVKVPFTTSEGVIEHLWAEVLEVDEKTLSVRYYSSPVTHSGTLERLHEYDLNEIEDWVVINRHGEIHGGFTQRVMFEHARRQWGDLPPELAQQESKYVA